MKQFFSFLILFLAVAAAPPSVQAFTPFQTTSSSVGRRSTTHLCAESDPNEIVARRIIVKGDVQGGYYRACVNNEVSEKQKLNKNKALSICDKGLDTITCQIKN